MPNPIANPQYTVTGKISDQFNIPVTGINVQAFDKKLRLADQPLGSNVITDAKELISVTFSNLSMLAQVCGKGS